MQEYEGDFKEMNDLITRTEGVIEEIKNGREDGYVLILVRLFLLW